VTSRSNEIIKQLNRLANDRNIPHRARNNIRDAVQHIRELTLKVAEGPGAATDDESQTT